jgi:hypothetical protein
MPNDVCASASVESIDSARVAAVLASGNTSLGGRLSNGAASVYASASPAYASAYDESRAIAASNDRIAAVIEPGLRCRR